MGKIEREIKLLNVDVNKIKSTLEEKVLNQKVSLFKMYILLTCQLLMSYTLSI